MARINGENPEARSQKPEELQKEKNLNSGVRYPFTLRFNAARAGLTNLFLRFHGLMLFML
jgi:hypothetical protein